MQGKFLGYGLCVVALVFLLGCATLKSTIIEESFGETSAGVPVTLYTLTSAQGMSVSIINYGAIVVSLNVPDKNGKFEDVVIGYNNMEDYQERSHNFGATIGRVAGRINNAQFTLDKKTYKLPKNLQNTHAVHGGTIGFDKVMWKAVNINTKGKTPSLTLQYLSRDGEMGFPGNLTVSVTYTLTLKNALKIDYRATTDKPTPINLTHHGYINLKGDGNGNVLDHQLQINASRVASTKEMVPTGETENIEGSLLDFKTPMLIGKHIHHASLKQRRGYNNYFIFDNNAESLKHVVTLSENTSGRTLEVWTTEPGMQLYTGNWLNSELIGKSGAPYVQYGGVCLETQHYPDSPNQPQFPNTILRPEKTFHSTTLYQFGLKN